MLEPLFWCFRNALGRQLTLKTAKDAVMCLKYLHILGTGRILRCQKIGERAAKIQESFLEKIGYNHDLEGQI